MDQITKGAFELGISGFLLLIVLTIVVTIIGRMFAVFQKMTEKFDLLTERIAESNKELSNQLIRSSTTQENILSIMKEAMVSVNNNTVRVAILETKMETHYEKLSEISRNTENAISRLEDVQHKMELIAHDSQ